MSASRLSVIVAMTPRRVIGSGGRLPWHLPADLRRFKRLTMGHHIIMGRKTFQSIGRPLPGRKMIVLTRQVDFRGGQALVARSLDEALALSADDAERFVIGGAQIYRLALPLAERLYLTLVHADVPGDTFFEGFDELQWEVVEQQERRADEKNPFDCTFYVYQRKREAGSAGRRQTTSSRKNDGS